MSEFDRRSVGTAGYPIESSHLDLEIYRLVTIFAASPTVASKRDGDWQWLKANFEFQEACRLLVSLAAMLRSSIDANPATAEFGLENHGKDVGTFISDVDRPSPEEPLTFREACNKILHADFINPDTADTKDPMASALNPFVYLYGTHQGKHWKATLDIYKFAQCAHTIS